MTDFELEQAIQQCNDAIADIKNQPSSAQVLRVLIARDRVNSVLEELTTSAHSSPSSERAF